MINKLDLEKLNYKCLITEEQFSKLELLCCSADIQYDRQLTAGLSYEKVYFLAICDVLKILGLSFENGDLKVSEN